MSRAAYTASCPGSVILVIDQYTDASPTMSVTNDAEQVVEEVWERFGDHRIAYRDTEGHWDELRHRRGVFTGFAPLDDELRKEVAQYA